MDKTKMSLVTSAHKVKSLISGILYAQWPEQSRL
jgi:hypothetical protein